MAKPFALEVVMDLSRKQADAAVADLAAKRAGQQAAVDTLKMLETCRQDYQMRFERSSLSGIGHEQWRNYHEFLHKIDLALTQQKQVCARCSIECQKSLEKWQLARIKLKSFGVLHERHLHGEARRVSQQEQREQDESSAAGHQRRQNVS